MHRAIIIFGLVLFIANVAVAQTKDVDGPLVIFMTPTGDDNNDGFTQDTPVSTLERVQEIIRNTLPNRDRDVEVRIGPGTYHNQRVLWNYTMPEHTIKFMPIFDNKVRPVFDGTDQVFDDSKNDGVWFTLDHDGGEKTNLVFHYIKVQNYLTAIDFRGDRLREAGSNGSNRIYGCYFYRIGNRFAPNRDPYTAAVGLQNSDGNTIANNHFVDIITTKKCGSMHALYVAHMSDRNQILRNRFENACGDPVRIRDFSNGNIVNDNIFRRVGHDAAYSQWFCDSKARCGDIRKDCICSKYENSGLKECPSWNNEFYNNILDKNWHRKALRDASFLVRPAKTCDQTILPAGCIASSSDACRLRTGGYDIAEQSIIGVGIDNGLFSRQKLDNQWEGIPNSGNVIDITVMPDGTLLGVGTDQKLYTRRRLDGAWEQVPNSGSVIAVDVMPNGTIVGVGRRRRLWTRSALSRPWEHVPKSGSVIDVAVMPDGTVLGIGPARGDLWKLDRLGNEWVNIPNSERVKSITVMSNGKIVGVGTAGDLWERRSLTSPWKKVRTKDTDRDDIQVIAVSTVQR